MPPKPDVSALSRFWYFGLSATGVTAFTRRMSRGGLILGYHNVVPAASPPFGDPGVHLSADRFEAQMGWLRAHYEVVPLGHLINRLEDSGSRTHLASITFDDAYGGTFEHAMPVLQSLNLPATVFVVSDAANRLPSFWWDHPSRASAKNEREHLLFTLRGDQQAILPEECFPVQIVPPRPYRPASWDIIRRAAAQGIEIGSHSCTHRTLTQLDHDELIAELRQSRERIAVQVGRAPDWFAYPYGIWDQRVRDAVAEAGYRGAVSLDAGLNTPATDPFVLQRVNVPASISLPALGAWAAGLRPGSRRPVAA